MTACMFCNVADNRYFDLAAKRGLHFDRPRRMTWVAQRCADAAVARQGLSAAPCWPGPGSTAMPISKDGAVTTAANPARKRFRNTALRLA